MKDVNILKDYNVMVDTSLEFWGDMDSYNDSLLEFKNSLESKSENLEYYKNNSDWDNYGILAHSIKSEAKYLGFMNDAEVFLKHEMAEKEANATFIENNFSDLKNTIVKIMEVLDSYFNSSYNQTNEKKHILIADDSNIMLNFIEQNIGEEYQVVKANNGKEAIEKLESMNIYALLLDLNMPTTNGFEVLEYLKSKQLIEKIPVVVITGDDTPDTINKAFAYPILDVLNKPFKVENINRVLVSIKSFYEKN